MSFNIRFDTQLDAPDHSWDRRKVAAAEIIRRNGPDVVGIQEALPHQLRDLLGALPAFGHVGRARDAEGHGEHVPILFRRSRFEIVRSGDFWLSETPESAGSLGWDALNPRICTWIVLRDEAGGYPFLVLNTHLDRWGEWARAEGAELLVEKVNELSFLPCILTGDLNALAGELPLAILERASLRDSFGEVHHDSGMGSVHHYGEPSARRIDFVLCDPAWRVLDASIVTSKPLGRWPSDHFPVMADLELIDAGGRAVWE